VLAAIVGVHEVARSGSESGARTIEQMRLINALCRFVEMAFEQSANARPRP
jgi:hypothetical protein